MEKYLNGNTPFPWSEQTPEPLRIMDDPIPDAFLSGVPQFLAWGLNSYAPMMCILGLLAFFKTYFGKLQSLLEDYFTSTLHVKATDETYEMILAWGSSRGLDNLARSIIARVGAKWKSRDGISMKGKKPICISPWNGGFWFRFRGTFLSYQTQTVSSGLHKEEVITITCLGRSVQVLKDLIEECRVEYLKQGQNQLTVFKNCGDYWKKTTTKEKRPLSTVITSETQKQELVDDVKEFLAPQTQAWYAERGIPYRRGYLLYGPPGTGKSSLISAVAGEFDLDIRAVSIPSVDDKKLEELFHSLPERCVVLLEDIDAVETDRSQNPDLSDKKKKMLSLSGLLNTLDGVASQDGRILFMTTNHIDQLDDALTRPGRIDKKFEIKLADTNVIIDLFKFIFRQDERQDTRRNVPDAATEQDEKHVAQGKVPDTRANPIKDILRLNFWWWGHRSTQKNVLDEGAKQDEDHVAQRKAPDMAPDHVNQLAVNFAAKIPRLEFSTAQIMSHLLQHKHSPEDALEHAEAWVTRNSKQVASRKVESELHPDDSEPLKDVLWMENSIRGNPVTGKLKRIEKSSDLHLMVPVSLPPSPCSSASQPCSASTSVPLSAVGEMTACITSDIDFPLNHGAYKMTEEDKRILGIQDWRQEFPGYADRSLTVSTPDVGDPLLISELQRLDGDFHQAGVLKKAIFVRTSIEQNATQITSAVASSNIETEIKAIRPNSPLANGCTLLPCNLGSPFVPFKSHPCDTTLPEGLELDSSDFPVGLWDTTQNVPAGSDREKLTEDIGGINVNSVLKDINEDKFNQPEDFLDGDQLSAAKSSLPCHAGDVDIDFLLDDGATKMSEDERCRIRKCWEEGKLSSDEMTLASVSWSDNRDRVQETEPKGGSGVRHSTGMARKIITVTTSIEQVVTPNTGVAEKSKLQTEVKAIPPSNAGNTNAVSCLTPMSTTADDNRATPTPSKTQIGVAQLRPPPFNADGLLKMKLHEPYARFGTDREDLSGDNTTSTIRGSVHQATPGDCKIGQLSVHELGTSSCDLFDQPKDYGGTDANDCLPPITEFVSYNDTKETAAINKSQSDTGDSSSTTGIVSGFSATPLSAVGAPVSEACSHSGENPDFQVELAVEAEEPRDKSETNDATETYYTDAYFSLNHGARRITKEDFVRLGLQGLCGEKANDATTGFPPIGKEDLRVLENAPKDTPFLTGDDAAEDGFEENKAENKTGRDIGDSELHVANADSLQTMKLNPPINFFGAISQQASPRDALPGGSPDWQLPKADDEPQANESAKTPKVTSSGRADESVWVKVEIGTDNLPTQTDNVEGE